MMVGVLGKCPTSEKYTTTANCTPPLVTCTLTHEPCNRIPSVCAIVYTFFAQIFLNLDTADSDNKFTATARLSQTAFIDQGTIESVTRCLEKIPNSSGNSQVISEYGSYLFISWEELTIIPKVSTYYPVDELIVCFGEINTTECSYAHFRLNVASLNWPRTFKTFF